MAKERQNVADLRKNCDAVWVLETPLADMTQARWDEYIRGQDDIKQSTLKSHLRVFTSLIRHHGLALGAPLIPEFDHMPMPKSERAERQDTITDEQFEAHKHRLLYPFVIVMAASGMRPHEAAGLADKSLRLRNVEDPGLQHRLKPRRSTFSKRQARPIRRCPGDAKRRDDGSNDLDRRRGHLVRWV